MPIVIDLIIGCRPNLVKAAALIHAAKQYLEVKINLIHTGQHTRAMSDPFFLELELPAPKHDGAGGLVDLNASPLDRLCTMTAVLGYWFKEDKPDIVMVVGDTDSTLAGALAAKKIGIPLIHVEAGLRCGNLKMQEEINRILVDSVSDILYTTTLAAQHRLIVEGHNPDAVRFVGNVMIDTLYRFLPQAKEKYSLSREPYALLTLHRAENVDHDDVIFPMLEAVRAIAEDINVVWPAHPRARSRIGAWKQKGQLTVCEPMGYLEFISALSSAEFVMTDSGGVQEETTALGVPCFTLRNETERPETESMGTNLVIGTDPKNILWAVKTFPTRLKGVLPLWDGCAADRILEDIVRRSHA